MTINSTTTMSEPKWRGWFRKSRRHSWRVLVEGNDERATHNAMLEASPGNCDLTLMEGHRDPNEKRHRR